MNNITIDLTQEIESKILEIVDRKLEELTAEGMQDMNYYPHNDTAGIFGVARQTLTIWRRQGKIEGKNIGGRWMYSERAIREADNRKK